MSSNTANQNSFPRANFVTYGDEKIYYRRLPRAESIRRLKIKVHPDCRIEVSAPQSASDQEVKRGVEKKARWIVKRLEVFRKQLAGRTPRKYVSGESHYYLGRQHLLKVDVSATKVASVKLLRGVLRVSVRTKNADIVKKQLNDWYRIRAREVFNNRLDTLLEKTLWVSDKPPMRILEMKSQWGSCSPNGLITLNPMLVKAPKECIDYVILHELSHLAEHNHSEKFYRLMRQVMPNWESVKIRLDANASNYLS